MEDGGRRGLWLVLAAGGGLAGLAGFALLPLVSFPPATGHAYAATLLALSLYAALHAGLALVGSLFVAARCRAGFVSLRRPNELLILRQWSRFAVAAQLVILLAIALPAWT